MRTLMVYALLSGGLLVQAGPANAASWCIDGTGKAMIGGTPQEVIAEIRRACKPGDTVGIPGGSSYVIGSVCDFSKSVYAARDGLVICVVSAK